MIVRYSVDVCDTSNSLKESDQLILLTDVIGSLAVQNKKGRGHKEDENDYLSHQMESLSINAGGGPSEKLSKKEHRRAVAAEAIDLHEHKGVVETAAVAEAVKAEEEARLNMEKLAGKAGKKVEWEGGVDGGEEDDGNKRRMSKKERKKAKQQVR